MANSILSEDNYTVFKFVDPVASLFDGLYKYKDKAERALLEGLNVKLKHDFGKEAYFKTARAALNYIHKIQDGELLLSQLSIAKDDVYIEGTDLEEKFHIPGKKKDLANRPHMAAAPDMIASAQKISRTKSTILKSPELTCKVCMDQPVSITFVPCGHLVVCGSCAPALGDCPVCRQPIKGTISTRY